MTSATTQENYSVQVKEGHYVDRKYLSPARWSTYAAIIDEVIRISPKSIIEIGPGPGVVTAALRQMGFSVKTLDLDQNVDPDYLLSATDENISAKIDKADLIIASEIFEHVKYSDFLGACGRLRNITNSIILTLPDTNEKTLCFGCRLRFPIFNKLHFLWKLRFWKARHEFDGEHYWEIGKKGFSSRKIRADITKTGWNVKKEYINLDNPYHHFFVLSKKHQKGESR